MKNIRTIAIGMLFFVAAVSCGNDAEKRAGIRTAIEQQLSTYPEATLRDLYKSFFQDQFGPGHLVSDTAAAARYLRSELGECDTKSATLYEPTGYQGNFYRVDLSIIKEGIVPFSLFFDVFLRSANAVKPISIDAWKEEWQIVLSVIETMDIRLKDYQQDKQEINILLQDGKYVMHHSRDFVQAYDPHYRIIEKKIFDKEILPLIVDR